jgi:epoxyqueuosine reductase
MVIEEQLSQEELARGLISEINEFIRSSPLNRMPGNEKLRMFSKPLVKYADGDDPFFKELKSIISPRHLTPREALALTFQKEPDELPEKIAVISWILPITETTRRSNRNETAGPSRFWSHTRWFGEKFNNALREYVIDILTEMGYLAVSPPLQPYFKMSTNGNGMYTNWSERHIAFAAGQGTFGLSDGFISEKGIAHRCGSVVTDMPLPVSPRTAKGPYDNCLFYHDGSCKVCAERCPAGAITSRGHDKKKCSDYLYSLGYSPKEFEKGYDLDLSVAGCGLCQTKTPCEYRIPLKIQRSRKEK